MPVSVAETATARTPATVSARDEDRERVAEPGDERVTAAEAGELAIQHADAREGSLLLPVDDELGSAAEELDELGGQLAARAGLAAAGCPSRASR